LDKVHDKIDNILFIISLHRYAGKRIAPEIWISVFINVHRFMLLEWMARNRISLSNGQINLGFTKRHIPKISEQELCWTRLLTKYCITLMSMYSC